METRVRPMGHQWERVRDPGESAGGPWISTAADESSWEWKPMADPWELMGAHGWKIIATRERPMEVHGSPFEIHGQVHGSPRETHGTPCEAVPGPLSFLSDLAYEVI